VLGRDLIEPNRLDAELVGQLLGPTCVRLATASTWAFFSSSEAIRPRTPPPAPSTRIAALPL